MIGNVQIIANGTINNKKQAIKDVNKTIKKEWIK